MKLAAIALLMLVELSSAADLTLEAGVAKVDITPSFFGPMYGAANRRCARRHRDARPGQHRFGESASRRRNETGDTCPTAICVAYALRPALPGRGNTVFEGARTEGVRGGGAGQQVHVPRAARRGPRVGSIGL